jgi:hypothetical protein
MAIHVSLRSFVCFGQDLNLAHDAEEQRPVVTQLTLDISLAATFSSIYQSNSAWFHVSKYKQNES